MKKQLFLWLFLFTLPMSGIDRIPSENDTPVPAFTVAILGNSRSEEDNATGINEKVLSKVLNQVKTQNPKAVFFTGDLVIGMIADKQSLGAQEGAIVVPGPEKDIYNNRWKRNGFVYNNLAFEKQLQTFSGLYKQSLGNTPFYPIPGFYESLGPDSFEKFAKVFSIKDPHMIGNNFVYGVAIGDAYFVILSTTYYDPVKKTVVEHALSGSILGWLNKELKDKTQKYPYVFVIGYEPAFSTTSASGEYRGLDRADDQRDLFWKILQDNNVVAYIASHEHLYDRTDRGGLWQIISGGAGAPLTKRNLEKAFYHYLLLVVPNEPDFNPLLRVIDSNGVIRDEFELKTNRKPIYQLRISNTLTN